MDVPSPINWFETDQATAWAETANAKRPSRKDFFNAIVGEIRAVPVETVSLLELGSGPGFLAERILLEIPDLRYTLLDLSPAMHDIARTRLTNLASARFVEADFKRDDWTRDIGPFDVVVTVQAVHELRHKRHAAGLHRGVRTTLAPAGIYLVCDHVAAPGGMSDTELYMTAAEQYAALQAGGFTRVERILEKDGLVLHRAAVT